MGIPSVAAGFVKDIEVEGDRVKAHFAPDTRDQAKVERMEADIRAALGGAGDFGRVEVERHLRSRARTC